MRSLFLSDLHIGSVDFNYERFEAFIDRADLKGIERLFLVGDILDLRYLRRRRESRLAHYASLEKLAMIALSMPTTYLWGNHDPEIERLMSSTWAADGRIGNVALARRQLHSLADGRSMLILHGDEMDRDLRIGISKSVVNRVTRYYYALLKLDRILFRLRSAVFRDAQAWMPRIKRLSRRWTDYVRKFEDAIAKAGQEVGVDVVLCGHIHVPTMRRIGSVLYINCGDWVEHCTAVVEDDDGSLRLLDWKGNTLMRCVDCESIEEGERLSWNA